MTHANGCLVLVAVTLLGLSALGEGAEAGRCRRGCGGLSAGPGATYLDAQRVPRFGRKGHRARPLRGFFSSAVASDEMIADNGSDGSLIPRSVAVAQALAAYPNGTALRVTLLPDPSPVYAVRLKVDGQVLTVFVDAQSGEVLGQ